MVKISTSVWGIAWGVRGGALMVEKERLPPLSNEAHRFVCYEIRQIAFCPYRFSIPVQVVLSRWIAVGYVIDCSRERTEEFVEAMLVGVEFRSDSQVPFAEQAIPVASPLEQGGQSRMRRIQA